MNFLDHYFTEKKKKKNKKKPAVNVFPAKAFNMASFFNSKRYDKGVQGTLDTGIMGEHPER